MRPTLSCPSCGYEVATYAEALEALAGGALCHCSAELDRQALERAVDEWRDEDVLEEGRVRADDESDIAAEEEDLFGGELDVGDDEDLID